MRLSHQKIPPEGTEDNIKVNLGKKVIQIRNIQPCRRKKSTSPNGILKNCVISEEEMTNITKSTKPFTKVHLTVMKKRIHYLTIKRRGIIL